MSNSIESKSNGRGPFEARREQLHSAIESVAKNSSVRVSQIFQIGSASPKEEKSKRPPDRKDIYKLVGRAMPLIVDRMKAQIVPKLDSQLVRQWSTGDIFARKAKITDGLISILRERMARNASSMNESEEMTVLRACLDHSNPFLSDLLRHRLDEMVEKSIHEIRESRAPKQTDNRETANVTGYIMILDERDIIPDIETTHNRSASSPEKSIQNVGAANWDGASIDADKEAEARVRSLWESAQNKPITEPAEMLTALDIIRDTDEQPPQQTNSDSLSPVVNLHQEETSIVEENRDNRKESLMGSAAKLVSKYRGWFAAAALAVLAGGSVVTRAAQNQTHRVQAVQALNVSKTVKKNIVEKKGMDASTEYRSVLSSEAVQKINQIKDPEQRKIFERMYYEGKFSFNNPGSNTVDQLLLPFYSIASASQREQLTQIAKQFNTGLYASAVRRFKGMTGSERRQLQNDKNPNNTKSHVYRALKNSTYGDPAEWHGSYKGKPYDEAFKKEMQFYERYEREMSGLGGCPKVFQADHDAKVKVFDAASGQYNAVIEAASKVVFGNDFYEKKNAAEEPEITVVWDLE